MTDNRSSARGIFDRLAITLSGLCLLHCLLLPVAIVSLPILTQFGDAHFHLQMLVVVIPVSLLAYAFAYPRHRNKAIVAWGFAGIAIMLVGGTIAHANFGAIADTALTIAGAVILASSHYFNNRLAGHPRAA
ncbi:MAG: MerC domain-containing protein [Woeseiaceae bacterium]|nr:MerC domain-containing protein [Woeseiaceae bacterium]